MLTLSEVRMLSWHWVDDAESHAIVESAVAAHSHAVVGGYSAQRYHTSSCSRMYTADMTYAQRWPSPLHAELAGRRPCEVCFSERHARLKRRSLSAVSLLKLRRAIDLAEVLPMRARVPRTRGGLGNDEGVARNTSWLLAHLGILDDWPCHVAIALDLFDLFGDWGLEGRVRTGPLRAQLWPGDERDKGLEQQINSVIDSARLLLEALESCGLPRTLALKGGRVDAQVDAILGDTDELRMYLGNSAICVAS